MKTREERAQAVREVIAYASGTEGYHRVTLGSLLATDGVKNVCEAAGAFWLMDVLSSYQPQLMKDPDLCGFQHWRLDIVTDAEGHRGGVVTCRADSGQPYVVRQDIEYTDFPLDEGIDLYVGPGPREGVMVALLPSEY